MVEISGSGDTWRVWLTERGAQWPDLLDEEPFTPSTTNKPRKRPLKKVSPLGPSKQKVPVLRSGSFEEPVAERTRQLFDEIMASEFSIVSSPSLEADGVKSWGRQAHELRSAKALLGDKWRVSTRTRNIGYWSSGKQIVDIALAPVDPVSYTHLTLPTMKCRCRSRWSPYH